MNAPVTPTSVEASAQWAQEPERSNMLMLRIMTWISLNLGRRISRVVLYGIAAYFLLFSPKARRASRQYLARALDHYPEWGDGFRHVLSFASTIHDRLYLVNNQFDLFDIETHQAELIDEAVADGVGVFLVGAHFGSFEVLRAVASTKPHIKISMLMYEENARKINQALFAINPHLNPDIIPLGRVDSMLRVQERLQAGHVVGMLADRSIAEDTTVTIPFLGCPAEWPIGPFRMAAILRRPVFFMAGRYEGDNRYHVSFETLADFTHVQHGQRQALIIEAMHRYVKLLELQCAEAPYSWFNFFDFWAKKPRVPTDTTVLPASQL